MKKMMSLWVILILMIGSFFVYAHSSHDEHSSFEQAEAIINAKIPCEDLSEEQLEMLGDYYMEQMHPGEEHETMDEMMGGEGSESLTQAHVNMAKRFYCGEHTGMDLMSSGGMMGGGMMNMMETNMMGFSNSIGHGSGMGWFGGSLLWLVYVALAAFIFGIVFWWTYKLMIKDRTQRK